MQIAINKKIFDLRYLALAVLIAAALPLLYDTLSAPGHALDDWNNHLRPAVYTMLRGGSPYYGTGFYNPPWTLLLLLPAALLPYHLSRLAIFLVSLAGFAYLIRRASSSPAVTVLFLTSLPVAASLENGNIDWIPLLSFVLPAPFALMLAAVKPQVGLGIFIYWLFQSWREGGPKLVFWNFLPVSLLFASSFVLYGPWILSADPLLDIRWNISVFPYTVPIGLFLLFRTVVDRDIRPAIASGLFVSPYFTMNSFSAILLSLLEKPKLFFLAWVIIWAGYFVLAFYK